MNTPVPPATPLIRQPGAALHRQLFLVLRDQILRGFYAAGSVIPREDELEKLFGVSRITVRRAVTELEQQGMVRKVPGKGTFVQAGAVPTQPAATLSLLQALDRQAKETEVKVLQVEVVVPPGAVALQLELPGGQPAVHAVRLRSAGGTPLMLSEVWLPERFSRLVTRTALRGKPLYELLLSGGVAVGRVVQEITAVAADPFLAGVLETPVGSPLLKLSRLVYATDRQPVEHITFHVSPERTRLLMEVEGESLSSLRAGHFEHHPEFKRASPRTPSAVRKAS